MVSGMMTNNTNWTAIRNAMAQWLTTQAATRGIEATADACYATVTRGVDYIVPGALVRSLEESGAVVVGSVRMDRALDKMFREQCNKWLDANGQRDAARDRMAA
jgi:hypothetical protein